MATADLTAKVDVDKRFLEAMRATRIEVVGTHCVVLDVGAITTTTSPRYWGLTRKATGDDYWFHGPSGTEGTLAEMIAGIVWNYTAKHLAGNSKQGESK